MTGAGAPRLLRLRAQVHPRAARTRIVARTGEALKVQVQAAPVDGAANDAVIALLARTLRVPRRAVHIRHGSTGRLKLIEIECDDPAACLQRLEEAVPAKGSG